MTVKEIKIGWKELQTDLNLLVAAINHNQPVRGHGIHIDETPTGRMISLAPRGDDSTNDSPGSDPVTGILYNAGFTLLTVIDPDTCKQTQVSVFVKAPVNVPYGTYYTVQLKSKTARSDQGQSIWNPESFIPLQALVDDTGVPHPSYPSDFILPH